jgi:mRNA-degrading endonuclease toxin of MazEF toxin-antitoxin module
MNPGELYMADTASGVRPVIVVSRPQLNRGRYVVAVLCTSTDFAARSKLANCVPFRAGQFGLTKDCVAQAESITFVPLIDLHLDRGPLGVLDESTFRDVIRAIGYMLDADCEPA